MADNSRLGKASGSGSSPVLAVHRLLLMIKVTKSMGFHLSVWNLNTVCCSNRFGAHWPACQVVRAVRADSRWLTPTHAPGSLRPIKARALSVPTRLDRANRAPMETEMTASTDTGRHLPRSMAPMFVEFMKVIWVPKLNNYLTPQLGI